MTMTGICSKCGYLMDISNGLCQLCGPQPEKRCISCGNLMGTRSGKFCSKWCQTRAAKFQARVDLARKTGTMHLLESECNYFLKMVKGAMK